MTPFNNSFYFRPARDCARTDPAKDFAVLLEDLLLKTDEALADIFAEDTLRVLDLANEITSLS